MEKKSIRIILDINDLEVQKIYFEYLKEMEFKVLNPIYEPNTTWPMLCIDLGFKGNILSSTWTPIKFKETGIKQEIKTVNTFPEFLKILKENDK